MIEVKFKGKNYKVREGKKGGQYITVQGNKKYIKSINQHTSRYKNSNKFKLFGGTEIEDADRITTLIYNQRPIDPNHNNLSYCDYTRVDRINPDYQNFLTKMGATRGDFTVTQKLKDCINTLNSRGQSILYIAFRYGNYRLCNNLLTNIPGIDINIRNTDGSTPITGAVYFKQKMSDINQLLKLFINKGGDISIGPEKEIRTQDKDDNPVTLKIIETPYYILNMRVKQEMGFTNIPLNIKG